MKGITIFKTTEIVRVDSEQVSDNSDVEAEFNLLKIEYFSVSYFGWS